MTIIKSNTDEKLLWLTQYIIGYYNEIGVTITHLKLQKLLYFLYWYSLTNLDSPIIENEFEARVNWPVIRKIYSLYNQYGFNNINKVEVNSPYNFSKKEVSLINKVLEIMAEVDPRQMVARTHAEGTAWSKAREWIPSNIGSNRKLEDENIRKEFLNYI